MQNTYQSTLEVKTKPRNALEDAENLALKGEYQKALDLIGDDVSAEALILKSEVFIAQKDYEKAVEILDVIEDESINDKKADALYKWAKIEYFPNSNLDKALNIINRALEICPDCDDTPEYWFLKGEIYQSMEQHIEARRCFLKAENRLSELEDLESQLRLFEIHAADTLINITGINFYRGLEPFKEGEVLNLVGETDNEHDPDAIACCIGGEVVGYVANSEYTLINDVKSASDIRSLIKENSTAEVLFIFQGEFVIARLII